MKLIPDKKLNVLISIAMLEIITILVCYILLKPRPSQNLAFLNLMENPVKFSTDYYGHEYQGNTENLIDASVVFFGAYEKHILHFLRDITKPNSIFADIGANTGIHSLFMSNHAKTVHAFDPYLPVINRLEETIKLNEIDNIKVHKIGLGSKNHIIPFYSPPDNNIGTGSFEKDVNNKNSQKAIELQVVTGDSFFQENEISDIDIIKIDIEGYEKSALQGLANTLMKNRPFVIMEVSILPKESFTFQNTKELIALFPKEYDFLSFEPTKGMERDGNYFLKKIDIDFSRRQQYNLLFFPEEKKEQFSRKREFHRLKK